MHANGMLDVWTPVSRRGYQFTTYEEEQRISEELDNALLERMYGNNDPQALAVKAEVERIDIRDRAKREHAAQQASGLFAGFSGLSLRDAFAVPRKTVPWVIEGLQRAGHKATLVAQFKTGKTTFAGNVVRSLADGVPLLGRFEVHPMPGNVGVLDYELTEDDALEQYRSMGLKREDRVHLESLRGTGFTLANDAHAEWTVEWLRAHDIQYLILDPFGRAMRGFGEENSNDDVRGFFMRLDTIAKDADLLGILMSVHTGRAAAEVGAERARGATILDDDPDTRWILTRDRSGKRFFRAEGRSGIDVEEFALDFDPALLRLTATELSRQDVSADKFIGPVLGFVEAHPGASTNEIKKGIEGTDKVIGNAINSCVRNGSLTREMKGQTHLHYPGTLPPPQKLRLPLRVELTTEATKATRGEPKRRPGRTDTE